MCSARLRKYECAWCSLCLQLEWASDQYWIDHSVPTSSDPELNTPSVRPITQLGGTQGGADKINACIERQIVAGTVAFLP